MPIRVRAEFDNLTAAGHRGAGLSGPTSLYDDSRVPAALANEQAGADLDPSQEEIEARFSSAVGTPGCASGGWYYGLDNLAPTGKTDLASVVLHELAHGLGFIKSAGVFREQVLDDATQTLLSQLSSDGYKAAIRTPMNVSWVGPEVRRQKNAFLDDTDGVLRPRRRGLLPGRARLGPPHRHPRPSPPPSRRAARQRCLWPPPPWARQLLLADRG